MSGTTRWRAWTEPGGVWTIPTPMQMEQAEPGQLHDPELVAEALVEVGVEADLVGVEGLGPVDVGHRDRHQLELHGHGRMVL